MQGLIFNRDPGQPFRVLLLGAHSDDIEIGCGGAVLRLAKQYPRLAVTWVVFAAHDDRVREARQSAQDFLAGVADQTVAVHQFRDGFLPYDGAQVKQQFEQYKRQLSPDLILTHARQDLHQDHRLINELTWNTWRDHLILEYEIPKYDGDLGVPNVFVPLDEECYTAKVDLLMRHFQTQVNKHWFTPEIFLGLMRIRGMESRSSSGYAEGFFGRKITL